MMKILGTNRRRSRWIVKGYRQFYMDHDDKVLRRTSVSEANMIDTTKKTMIIQCRFSINTDLNELILF